MTNGDFKDLSEVQDIESHNIYAMATRLHIPKSIRWKMIQRTSRDNARTPMQWNGGVNAGFTSGEPWLKVNGNYKEINVAAEEQDPNGVLAFWKQMIQLRKTNPVLINGDFCSAFEGKSVYAFERSYQGQTLMTLCNMCSKEAEIPDAAKQYTHVLVSNYSEVSAATLRPFEFRLLSK